MGHFMCSDEIKLFTVKMFQNRWQSDPNTRAGLFLWPLGAIKNMRTKIRQKPRTQKDILLCTSDTNPVSSRQEETSRPFLSICSPIS